ncbi:ATP-binding protein [Petroclostridium sp. X23]|uniref:PAS domain-containing sensor histidine kinase n=1 Tax=Petroclostridium sp. X23 TaxID=3045146 RepID=UPI0024ACE537|nr:ATP-binding protein [Petroclostridium sp. X23]WHH60088.1 ATP-binding protein [Petroclostridium sp. X23]
MIELYNNSRRQKDELAMLRVLVLLASMITPIINIIWNHYSENYHPNMKAVWACTTIFFATYYLSYKSKFVQKNFYKIFIFLIFMANILTIYFSHKNFYAYEYTILLLMVMMSVAIIFQNPTHILIYNSIIFGMIAFSLSISKVEVETKSLILGSVLLFCIVSYLMLRYRHKIQRELQLSEEHFRTITENSMAGYFYINADREVAYINRAMSEMYGFENQEDLIGKKCKILNADCSAAKNPKMCRLMDENECSDGKLLRRICKDGTFKHHILWIRKTVDECGGSGIEGLIFDVTDKIAAEVEKAEREERYKQLLNSMNQGFAVNDIITDEKGIPCNFRIIGANPAFEKITGLKVSKIVGKTILDILPNIEPDWIKEFGEVAIKGKKKHFEKYLGDIGRYFEVYAYPYQGERFAIMLTDVTERIENQNRLQNAKDEAEKLTELKNNFISNVSHELRTPMNGIMGMIQLLEMSECNSEQMEYIHVLKKSSNRMITMINNIMYLVSENSDDEYEEVPFDLRSTVKRVIHTVKIAEKNKSLDFSYRIDGEIPNILIGFSEGIEKILSELLDNAIKFTDSGRVSLDVSKVQTYYGDSRRVMLEFSVKDTGIGIKPEISEKIFNKFSQIDASYTKRYEGIGIGLAICKKVVEKMDGKISFKSELGSGSEFVFYLVFGTSIDEC